MLRCCISFHKKKKKSAEEISVKEIPSDHYSKSLENSIASIEQTPVEDLSLKPESEIEGSTDSSSQPLSNDAHRYSPGVCPLFYPSKDPLAPSSDLVSSNSSYFDMLLDLEAESDWETKFENPTAYVMIKNGSLDHPEVPMMKAFFDMEMEVDPEVLVNIIYKPELRRKWDKNIQVYNEIQHLEDDAVQYYMHNKAPWPFADRDFVETRLIRRRMNGDVEIFFSASQNPMFEKKGDKVIRGETILGGQIYRKRISPNTGKISLMITSIFQADMKGEIPKKLLKVTLPSSVFKWFKTIKRQVEMVTLASN